MAFFRDSTGRPGPATWEVGTYPDGQADHPVGGVSWFEAVAYARFAGKELPTVHHWMQGRGGELLRRHPAPQQLRRQLRPGGQPPGPLPLRRLRPGRQRQGVVLEPGRREAVHPRRRLERAELRVRRPGRQAALGPCAQPRLPLREVRGSAPPEQLAAIDLVTASRDYAAEKPVSDAVFRIYRGFYSYDKTELKPTVDSVDESEHWRHEKVSFDAAYGGERVPAHLFLPRNASPPYQTVVYFPTGEAFALRRSDDLRMNGLGVPPPERPCGVAAHLQGHVRAPRDARPAEGRARTRDVLIQMAKDLGRSIDYLETRPDIDRERLAFYGVSAGAALAPPFLAIEQRFKAAVLQGGGLAFRQAPARGGPVQLCSARDGTRLDAERPLRLHEPAGDGRNGRSSASSRPRRGTSATSCSSAALPSIRSTTS